jgi:3'(2'), 5'-bisphosphate nucleotidase
MAVDHPGDDAALAEELAGRAGELLLALRADDPRAADDRSDAWLNAELTRRRPGDAVLSEESPDPAARLSASRVWIVDPLDGTREYREPGRTDWAVHIALWADGELAAGVVALPALGELWTTARPAGKVAGQVRRIAVSRTRAPDWVRPVAAELGAELVPIGSAGAKVAAVLRGDVDAYLHDGGQYEWDSAAPVAVARAAGLHAGRVDGTPLRYNQPDPWCPDLLVCPPAQAARIVDLVARYRTMDLVARDGVARDGVARDGVARDGVARDGVARDGVVDHGVADHGKETAR